MEYQQVWRNSCPANSQLRNSKTFPLSTGSTSRRELRPRVRSSLERILETQNGNAISQEEAYALAHARRRRSARPARRRQPAARRTLRQPRHLRGESQHQLHQHLFRGMQVLRLQPRPARVRHVFSRARIRSRKRPSKPGNSAPPKSAFRADCRTACLRFTIATFCAR